MGAPLFMDSEIQASNVEQAASVLEKGFSYLVLQQGRHNAS